jgi:hypothetical protein
MTSMDWSLQRAQLMMEAHAVEPLAHISAVAL